MRKSNLAFEENGVRIYSKPIKQQQTKDEEYTTNSQSDTAPDNKILNDCDINSNITKSQLKESLCHKSTKSGSTSGDCIYNQLTTTQQVLDVLNEQVGSLNALQNTRDINRLEQVNCTKKSFSYNVSVDNLLSVASDSPSPQARLQVLDYYVKHNINSVGTGECGCHYDYASGSNVLSKLDECVRDSLPSLIEATATTTQSLPKQQKQPRNKRQSSVRSSHSSGTSADIEYLCHDSVQSALGSVCSLESDSQGNNHYRFVNSNQHLFIDNYNAKTYGRHRNVTDTDTVQSTTTESIISFPPTQPVTKSQIQGLSETSGNDYTSLTNSAHVLDEHSTTLYRQQQQQHYSYGTDSYIDVTLPTGEFDEDTEKEEEVLSDTSNALVSLVDSFDALSQRSPSPICNSASLFINDINEQLPDKEAVCFASRDIPLDKSTLKHNQHHFDCLNSKTVLQQQDCNATRAFNNNNNNNSTDCLTLSSICQDSQERVASFESNKTKPSFTSAHSSSSNHLLASNCSITNCRRFSGATEIIHEKQPSSSDLTTVLSSLDSSSSRIQVRKKRRLDLFEDPLQSEFSYCSRRRRRRRSDSPLVVSSSGYHSIERLAAHKMGSENNSDIININRSKRRDFFTEPTIRTKIEKDTRLGRQVSSNSITSNGSTSKSQSGKDLANVGLRSCNSSDNCTSSISANRFLTASKEEANSMKAAKDIVKMSAPSLSTLQYLPSQIDSSFKDVLKRRQKSKRSVSESNDGQSSSNLNTVNVIVESRENLKHSESCLLDRLCLCNCMARSHYDLPKASLSDKSETSASKKQPTTNVKLSSKKSDFKRPKSSCSDTSKQEEEEALSTKSAGVVGDARRALSPQQSRLVGVKISRENEKQSPSFLNILKSPSAHISRYSRELRRSQPQRLEVCQEDISVEDSSANELAGFASASVSISRNSYETTTTTTTENESGSSQQSFQLRARSSSFATSGNRASFVGNSSLSGAKPEEDGCFLHSTETVTRPQSAEPQHESAAVKAALRGQHSQKVSNYKKFLSPSKLFSSSNRCLNQRQIDNPTPPPSEISIDDELYSRTNNQKSPQHHQSSSSFLSRSLHRLSGRRSSNQSKESSGSSVKRKRHEDREFSRSACVSPTISISTAASQQIDSLADSINSLDEEVDLKRLSEPRVPTTLRLDKTRLFLAPEVRLTRRIGQSGDLDENLSNLSTSSACEMTRFNGSSSSGYRYRQDAGNDRHANNAYRDTYSPVRYGSEFSDYTSDASADRACSVPASPNATRRRTSNRSRTQRLAHSPVPFHSPATQSTKIEDGLKVCSTEHFEKHIGNIKDNQEEAQKYLFRTWINHFCPNLIHRDIVEELRDGIKLIGLLAYLTRDRQLFSLYDKLHRDKRSYINRIVTTPSSKLRQLSNVSTAIDYLRKNRGMKLINLNPMDIVSGKPNVILGLCWNIILNFQLEQNYLNSISSNGSSSASEDRVSYGEYAIDDSPRRSTKQSGTGVGYSPAEEYSSSDLVVARKRLLDFINKRFDLKLTNLTSNLLDGDVMLVIVRNLLPQQIETLDDFKEKRWELLSNDEKLDQCFDLALKHLNVPRLFSANDLRQQTISDNNSKPLLVYLTMLLNCDLQKAKQEGLPSTDVRESIQNLNQHQENEDKQAHQEEVDANEVAKEDSSIKDKLGNIMTELEREDSFAVDRLQSTLAKINELENMIEDQSKGQSNVELDVSLTDRLETLKGKANQIETLISWINQADALFETTQKSAIDLTNSIEEYREFFSQDKVPKISVPLCPTLERQYRECLGTARQRVLIMEQTLKNWYDYERARQELRDWLSTAELKLTDALLPLESSDSDSQQVERHTDRLRDVIEYFNLETIDVILQDQSPVNLDLSDRNKIRMSCDSLASRKLYLDESNSISGSLLSLGSTSSRISTLQSSSKAKHNSLLDNFELKCRLLATMLDTDQKESLLLGVKELKSRLKYITEHRVPQVVGQLKFHINRLDTDLKLSESNTSQVDEEPSATEEPVVEELKVKSDKLKPQLTTSPTIGTKSKNKARKQQNQPTQKSQKSRNSNKSKGASKNKQFKDISKKEPKEIDDLSDDDISITRKIWHKVVRAYRASFSLNIVLLICLAGICVVPLIHRDACCELVSNHIYPNDFSVNEKPT